MTKHVRSIRFFWSLANRCRFADGRLITFWILFLTGGPVTAGAPLVPPDAQHIEWSAAGDHPESWPEGLIHLSGYLLPGGTITGAAEPGYQVTLDERQLPLGPNGEFVFGFGRDANGIRQLILKSPGGQSTSMILALNPRDYVRQEIEGISKRIMEPSEEDLQRIRKETAAVVKARAHLTARTDFLQDFIWPTHGPITGVYGSQRVYNGKPGRPHYGVDIAAPTGTPVVAPAGGVVQLAHPDMFYSGGTIILDHGQGLSSTFIHLSKVVVEVGQIVEQGDIIGEVGASGRATGPHLDWRINWFRERLDPALLMVDVPMLTEGKSGSNVSPED